MTPRMKPSWRCASGTGASAQRGQASSELVIITIVLVPLLLLIPVIGKYIHLRHLNQQAARSAAWQATVTPDYEIPSMTAQQTIEIDRHFNSGTSPIRTNPAPGAITSPMLDTFSGQPLVAADGVTIDYRDQSSPSKLGQAAGLLSDIPLPGLWETPNGNGLVTARMDVDIRNLRYSDGTPARFLAPFDTLDLAMSAEHALVTDPWNAAGPGHAASARTVEKQVTPLVLTRVATECDQEIPGVLCPLNEFHEAMAPLSDLPIPILNVVTRLELGLIEPDVVPYDKLQPYVPSSP